jgi:hypothetical protein
LQLTKREIMKLTTDWIGVYGGYLGDFSYRTHEEFYPQYCDLDIDPSAIEGTTRQRFIAILEGADPPTQARILRGVLERFPLDAETKPNTRTQRYHDELVKTISRLEGIVVPGIVTPKITSAIVERAIADAEILLRNSGPTSAIDRIHTSLHGYLRAVCDSQGIAYTKDTNLVGLLKLITATHPAFTTSGHRSQDITSILRALSSILDSLNPIRNNASVAHPNEQLLDQPEAMLVINAARTVLHYLESKLTPS